MTTTSPAVVPAVIRGEVCSSELISFGGRWDGVAFAAPNPASLLDRLPLRDPGRMADLYDLRLDDIIDYLIALGEALDLDRNDTLRLACEASFAVAPVTPPILEHQYRLVGQLFRREVIDGVAASIGREYLDGWVAHRMVEGHVSYLRAFGSRSVHVVAGNSPVLTAWTILRNAVIRGDAIIKSPSNDAFTASAIGQTMAEMAPDHPLTKHLSVAYWKGGDESFERELYHPQNIEKIVAWGGFASVKHVTKYIQPGLELISLDPKRSASFIGHEAFLSEDTMREAAQRLAFDIGAVNQQGCVSARVVYVEIGTGPAADAAPLTRFAGYVHQAMLALPTRWSTPAKGGINAQLKTELWSARAMDDWYTVVGGDDEGAVIVSKLSEPVGFAALLADRVANLVPVGSVEEVLPHIDAYTQTVGVYPDQRLAELADQLAIQGVQRVTSLGYAPMMSMATPAQDGIEPLRRMCKWVVRDHFDVPGVVAPWASEDTT